MCINNYLDDFTGFPFSPTDLTGPDLAATSGVGLSDDEGNMPERGTLLFGLPFSPHRGINAVENTFSSSLSSLQEHSITNESLRVDETSLLDGAEEAATISSESEAPDDSPIFSFDNRKRGREEVISFPSQSNESSLTDECAEVAYIIYLLQLFKNTLPPERPKNISEASWKNLSEIAEQKKLIHIISRVPFTYAVHSDLDFVYYTLVRLGTLHAMEQVDRLDATFEERAQWWNGSSIFLPVTSVRAEPDQFGNKRIQRSHYLPPDIEKYCGQFSESDFMILISKILQRTLTLSLENDALSSTFQLGAERREIPMIRPITETFRIATREMVRHYEPAPVQSSIESSLNTSLYASQVHVGDLLTRYFALSSIITQILPETKPGNFKSEEWHSLKRLKRKSTLIRNIKKIPVKGIDYISFALPTILDGYWRNQTTLGKAETFRLIEHPAQVLITGWWLTNKNFKGRYTPIAIMSRPTRSLNDGLEQIYRMVQVPEQLSQNPIFSALEPSEALNVMRDLFMETVNNCYNKELLSFAFVSGFTPIKNPIHLCRTLENGFALALDTIIAKLMNKQRWTVIL